jgi:hypothetical protein
MDMVSATDLHSREDEDIRAPSTVPHSMKIILFAALRRQANVPQKYPENPSLGIWGKRHFVTPS